MGASLSWRQDLGLKYVKGLPAPSGNLLMSLAGKVSMACLASPTKQGIKTATHWACGQPVTVAVLSKALRTVGWGRFVAP